MAQKTLKKLKYDNSEIIVEAAYRDGLGRTISSTYLTEVPTASSSTLGGIKVGTRLTITNGVLSADAQSWSTVTSKPFATVNSSNEWTNSTKDFIIPSTTTSGYPANELNLNYNKLDERYVKLATYNTFISTTAPATYQPKHANLTSISGLSTSSTGLIKLENGTAKLDSTAYITASVNNLSNYYKKSETYSRTEVDGFIRGIHQFTYQVASELPTASADTMYTIYLIPSTNSATQNAKDEFVTIDSGSGANPRYVWEQIGSTTVDLSGYPTMASASTNTGYFVTKDGTSNDKKIKVSSYWALVLASAGTSSNWENDNAIPTGAAVNNVFEKKLTFSTGLTRSTNTITLNTASASALGGIKIGTGLSISSGVVSVASAPTAAVWSGNPFSVTDVTYDNWVE